MRSARAFRPEDPCPVHPSASQRGGCPLCAGAKAAAKDRASPRSSRKPHGIEAPRKKVPDHTYTVISDLVGGGLELGELSE